MKNKTEKKLQYISVDKLIENPLNGKLFRQLKQYEMDQLELSIKRLGVLTPAVCYATTDDTYMLISGHNRLSVLQSYGELWGIDGMHCEVIEKPKSDLEEMLMMVAYNLGRGLVDTWVIKVFVHLMQILSQIRKYAQIDTGKPLSEEEMLDFDFTVQTDDSQTYSAEIYELFKGIKTEGKRTRDILESVLGVSSYQVRCMTMLCSLEYRKSLYDRILKVAKIKKEAIKQWDAGFDEIIAAVENDEITLNAACEQVRAFVAEIESLEKKKQPKAEKPSKPKREPKPEKIDIEIEDADDDTQTPVLPTLRITHERLMEDFYATCDPDAPFTKIAEDKIAIPAADEDFVYVVDIDVLREHLMTLWKE